MEFHLIDLITQMPSLPCAMRQWPQERFLSWLRCYGEVWYFSDILPPGPHQHHTYYFRSWCGLGTHFIFHAPGNLFIPASPIQAWQDC
jgi:hypothetical protein